MSSLYHNAAREYAAGGLPVFPCFPNGKAPLTPNGFKNATTDAAVIDQWWTRTPLANVGIPTGPVSGLYVLDVDAKTEPGRLLADQLARDPLLLTEGTVIRTPGNSGNGWQRGTHVWVWSDADQRTTSLGIGELKGGGGYVIAPPSSRGGRSYVRLSDYRMLVDDPTAWTRELLALFDVAIPDKPAGPTLGVGWAASWLRTPLAVSTRRAPEGLPRMVGYLRGHSVDCETAVAILELWDARNPAPLGPAEVRRHVEAMYARYGVPSRLTGIGRRIRYVIENGQVRA